MATWLSGWQRASSEFPCIFWRHFIKIRQNSPEWRDHPSHRTGRSTTGKFKRDLETKHVQGWPGDTARPPGLHTLVHCQAWPGRPPAWSQWSFSHALAQHNSLKHNFLMSPGVTITAPCSWMRPDQIKFHSLNWFLIELLLQISSGLSLLQGKRTRKPLAPGLAALTGIW